jgi:hypothetical protein
MALHMHTYLASSYNVRQLPVLLLYKLLPLSETLNRQKVLLFTAPIRSPFITPLLREFVQMLKKELFFMNLNRNNSIDYYLNVNSTWNATCHMPHALSFSSTHPIINGICCCVWVQFKPGPFYAQREVI